MTTIDIATITVELSDAFGPRWNRLRVFPVVQLWTVRSLTVPSWPGDRT